MSAVLTGPKLRIITPVAASPTVRTVTLGDPGTDPAAYSAAVTYPADATVSYNDSIWLSLQGTNLSKTPGAATSAAWWVRTGPTNAAAMFDGAVNTYTRSVSADDMVVELSYSGLRLDAVALVEATCVQATVEVEFDGAIVHTETRVQNTGSAADWWTWFFGDKTEAYTGDIVFKDLPPYAGATIRVRVVPVGSEASVGLLLPGNATEIGVIESGWTADILDYSTKTTDAYGTTTLTQGAYARRPSLPVVVENGRLQFVRRFLARMRATPLYVYASDGDSNYDLLNAYGWLRNHRMQGETRDLSRMTVEAEGLI